MGFGLSANTFNSVNTVNTLSTVNTAGVVAYNVKALLNTDFVSQW